MSIFVDTNVLVNARDASEPDKQPRAQEWIADMWRRRTGRVSFQVLEEYYVTVTAKLRPGLPADEARDDVRHLLAWRPVVLDGGILEAAWALTDRFAISYWDAAIAASARSAGCAHVLTEDM